MKIRDYQDSDQEALIKLWQRCELVRPWNDPVTDVRRKQTDKNGWFLVAELEAEIVGSIMIGYDGHRGSINYLAVSPEHRGHGYGELLMKEAEQLLIGVGCPKINLQVRSDNRLVLEFYDHIGYQQDPVVSLGKRLIADN